MARHLHQQAGGDPAQGPVRELANEPPSPRATDDFPDTPEANAATRGDSGRGDLDPDQLDDFAARLGLADPDTDTDSDTDTGADVPDDRGAAGPGRSLPVVGTFAWRPRAARALEVLARAAGSAGDALAGLSRRIEPDDRR